MSLLTLYYFLGSVATGLFISLGFWSRCILKPKDTKTIDDPQPYFFTLYRESTGTKFGMWVECHDPFVEARGLELDNAGFLVRFTSKLDFEYNETFCEGRR